MPQSKDLRSVYIRLDRAEWKEYQMYVALEKTSIVRHLTTLVREYLKNNRLHSKILLDELANKL